MAIFIDKHVFAYYYFYRYASTLEHALNFLKCMLNEHAMMNLVRLNQTFNPH